MRHRKGFTLVELLVVIGIIGLLMGILLPTFAGVKGRAKGLQCSAQLASMGKAFIMFTNGSDGQMPRVQWYQDAVADQQEPGYIDQYSACKWHQEDASGKDLSYWCDLGCLYEKGYVDSGKMFYCPAVASSSDKYRANCDSQSGVWGDRTDGYVFSQYTYWPQSKACYTAEQLGRMLAGTTGNYVAGMPMTATRTQDLNTYKPLAADYSFHSYKGHVWALNALFPDGHVIMQPQPRHGTGAGLWHAVDQWPDGDVTWLDGHYIWATRAEQGQHMARPVPITVFMSALQP